MENIYLTSEEYGKALYEEEKNKYKDIYIASPTDDNVEDSNTIDAVNNYNVSAHIYGDGIYETSYLSYDGTIYTGHNWNGNRMHYMRANRPLFYRGGDYSNGVETCVFAFDDYIGIANENATVSARSLLHFKIFPTWDT